MGETQRIIYGVHQFTPYSRVTRLPFGTARILGEASFTPSGELNELFGGSNRFAWAVEDGNITGEIAFKAKQIEDFMFEVFGGKKPTTIAAEALGAIGEALTNKKGVSVLDAVTGIASVSLKAGETANVKTGLYVVKAVSATTVDVFAPTDVDFARGVDKVYEDNLTKITAAPLTIVAATPVEVPGFGVELTGGSGAIALVTDDTATYEVRAPNAGGMEVTIGGTNDVYPEFGALLVAQQRSNFELFIVDALRCKAIGVPIPMGEKAFAEHEFTARIFYDPVLNAVAKFRSLNKLD